MPTLHEHRQRIRHLINDESIVDAPTAYYALYHPPDRSALATYVNAAGRVGGFVGRLQTGHDLFRPLVTLRCQASGTVAAPEIAADLLAELLTPGRPYLFFANLNQLPHVGGSFHINTQRLLHIYYLDPARFKPTVNVLVVERQGANGPRFEIHSGGLQAVAGLNWQSPGFAEVYVHTEAEARQRGWGRSVVSACTQAVLAGGRLPLYLVDTGNAESIRLAGALGYVDSGARQIYAEVTYQGHPLRNQDTGQR